MPAPEPSRNELFVVEVYDWQSQALVGHDGTRYVSPPQERGQALELVELALGYEVTLNGDAERCWRLAVPGGQRSVTLRRVS